MTSSKTRPEIITSSLIKGSRLPTAGSSIRRSSSEGLISSSKLLPRTISGLRDLWAQQLGPSQDPRHPAYKNGEGLGGQTGNDAALIQKAIDDGTFQGTGLSYKISWGDGVVDGVDQGIIVADVALSSAAITGTPRLKSKFAFNDGEWVHMALTVDGNRNATLYVNGELHDTFMGSGAPIYGNGSIVIGNRWLWDRDLFGGSTFNGCIDEVRLLRRALSVDEIKEIYGNGVDGTCPPPESDSPPENNAPVVDAGPDGSIDEGGTFETSVSFTDDGSGPWTAVVDYGDGNVENPAVASTSFGLSYTYAQDGTYTVTVTVTDDAGAEGSSSASVVVSNVPPVVDAGPDATILEGGTFESAGSFTDPGADSWNATVDYGGRQRDSTARAVGKGLPALPHIRWRRIRTFHCQGYGSR